MGANLELLQGENNGDIEDYSLRQSVTANWWFSAWQHRSHFLFRSAPSLVHAFNGMKSINVSPFSHASVWKLADEMIYRVQG